MSKPLIGVMPLFDDEKDSLWMLPGYMQGIEQAGGIPIMLPLTDDEKIISQLCGICSGFLFTGGHDVSPSLYGEEARFENVECCEKRDELEKAVFKLAAEYDKPILGICRGIQFINAVLGGTLYQHLPSEHASRIEHHQSPPYDKPVHSVDIVKNSPLYKLLGKDTLMVNSYHHQAVKTLSPELLPMAYSEDGLIEGVYMPSRKFVRAVQWHPEFSFKSDTDSKKIFADFVSACRE